jgi:hypothetical protein
MSKTRVMLGMLALLMVGHAQSSHAQATTSATATQPITSATASQPRSFSSAGEAAHALFEAADSHDEQAVQAILGAGKEVTSTGDDAEDKLEREQFCQKYKEMHRLVREPDGTTVLYIGAENWPFPIPLTSTNGRWSFDSKTGSQEMLFRRIGENEATALDVCRTLVVLAARPQSSPRTSDPSREYAHIVAKAASTGTTPEPQRFHGYYFRALGPQPAKKLRVLDDRVTGGKQTDVLTFVAYPAEYRSSGVMTFLVSKNGLVYERDLGPNTLATAQAMSNRRPTAAWHLVNMGSDDTEVAQAGR